MRPGFLPLLLPLLLLAQGCSDDTLTIRGYLAPGSEATDVYVVGQPIRSPVEGDSFVVSGIAAGTAELEFTRGDERLGRMSVEEWNGSPLVIRDIFLDDGAYPGRLEGDGAARINGLRMAPAAHLPRRVEVESVVLSASRRGDALVVRPRDGSLPDLRVVITPGTVIEGAEGRLNEVDLEFGEHVGVEGTVEAGYVVATRLVLLAFEPGPPTQPIGGAPAPTGDERTEDESGDDEAREDSDDGVGSLVRPGGGRGRGRGIQPRD